MSDCNCMYCKNLQICLSVRYMCVSGYYCSQSFFLFLFFTTPYGKDKARIQTVTTWNRCLSVIQQHKQVWLLHPERNNKIKQLWQTYLVVAVLRSSEEIHAILNRLNIAQAIHILFDFADIRTSLIRQKIKCIVLHKGANSLNICMKVHEDLLWLESWLQNTAVTWTTDPSCRYYKSGRTVWLKWEPGLQLSALFTQGFTAERLLLFFKGTHAFPFTSEINFPPWYTNLAVLSPFQWFLFFLARGRKRNTGGFVLRCGGGWDPPPLPATQLDVGRWDRKQVSPMTFSTLVLTSYFTIF